MSSSHEIVYLKWYCQSKGHCDISSFKRPKHININAACEKRMSCIELSRTTKLLSNHKVFAEFSLKLLQQPWDSSRDNLNNNCTILLLLHYFICLTSHTHLFPTIFPPTWYYYKRKPCTYRKNAKIS